MARMPSKILAGLGAVPYIRGLREVGIVAKVNGGRAEVNSERRKLILDIAARLFARGGYSATTVRDIADEAGILSGSLYHHFSSKEAIIREILEDYLEGLLGNYDQIVGQDLSAKETLRALVQSAFEMIAEQPHSVALYQNEASFLQTLPGFEFLTGQSQRIEKVWQGQIAQGQAEGDVRDTLDPAMAYRFIRDAMWSVVRWYRPGGPSSIEEVQAQFSELLRGVLLTED